MTAAASCAAGREGRRGPGLVVVLEESGELALIVEPGVQVLAHRLRVSLAQAIVEPLVVGVIEPLLQHRPFQVPVHLGHEAEARHPLPHSPGRLRPEQWRPAPPGPLEDVGQDEHGHVAAHPVTLSGDLQQLADHRLLRGRIAVVELQRVRPAGEVRVAPIGQDQVAPLPLDPRVVLRRLRQVELGPGDVVLRVVLHPGMIQAPCGWGRSRASAAARACGDARAVAPAPHPRPARDAPCSR